MDFLRGIWCQCVQTGICNIITKQRNLTKIKIICSYSCWSCRLMDNICNQNNTKLYCKPLWLVLDMWIWFTFFVFHSFLSNMKTSLSDILFCSLIYNEHQVCIHVFHTSFIILRQFSKNVYIYQTTTKQTIILTYCSQK